MRLAQAFGIKDGDVVSLVGGGGKTTAMFRLAEELAAAGRRVVTTTTTRIFAAQIKLAPSHICVEEEERALDDLRAALQQQRHVLVIGTTDEEGKACGVEPEFVDRIRELALADVIINEADGSRMRPFKAPGEHEPVVPSCTTLLVPVVGVDVIGAKLDDEHVHRAERVAALSGVPLGVSIDPELVARVLSHADGGLKHRPAQARVIPLINKAQNVGQLLVARDIAEQLLRAPEIAAVAIGAVRNAALPVSELHSRVSAIVLAAGGSSRMQGSAKQLLPWEGATMVRHAVDVASRAQVTETIAVLGNEAQRVEEQLAGSGARIVQNPDWAEGRSTSVRAGLAAISERSTAAIFINADQPFLTPQVIDTVLQRYFQTLAPIVVPLYDGVSGSPVLFARECFDELRQLRGESGGKQIVQARREEVEEVNVINSRAAIDVDTPEDYRRALDEARARPSDGIFSTIHPDR